jgi:S1-C subfamily serine protease
MRAPRPPDWLVYLTVVAALTAAAIFSGGRGAAPAARPLAAEPVGGPLGPASPFDPSVVVKAPAASGQGAGAGTAFSVASSGVWLTARHVVDGCAKIAIVISPGRGVAASVRIDPGRETAILFTRGGAPALPLVGRTVLHRGAIAFHPGFPQGRAGEAATRLVRRERLVLRGRRARSEPILAWAEVGRTPGLSASLAGLSGAPALDSQGRVIGVTVAQSPRRGRLYTTTPGALRAALATAGVTPSLATAGAPIGIDTYGRVADDLRRNLRVAQVVCLAS